MYQWVKKYENEGEDGLENKRGPNKEVVELIPEEKFSV